MKKIPFSQFAGKYKKTYAIPAGSSINTNISGVKLISVTAPSITGSGVLVYTNINGIAQILNSNYVSSVYSVSAGTTQNGTDILIYRDNYTIHIRNNSPTPVNVTVEEYNI